jgi:hypothetical protein
VRRTPDSWLYVTRQLGFLKRFVKPISTANFAETWRDTLRPSALHLLDLR